MLPLILSGADLVLPDRVLSPGTLVIEHGRIVEIEPGARPRSAGTVHVELHDHLIVPGFIDVHVHGVEGFDMQDPGEAVEAVARRLPRYGVTAFCPTSIACAPDVLARMFDSMRRARAQDAPHARVLRAHLESNFIHPEYCGAQPVEALRNPPAFGPDGLAIAERQPDDPPPPAFTGADVMRVIEANREEVGILTVAVELPRGLELAQALVAAGHRVSLGHSGATFEQALAGVEAGARHATHLFNRMSPMSHRAPGLVGAVLHSPEIAAEIVCDGHHVHPAVLATAIRAKGTSRIMAITDGTAGAGLPVGTKVLVGGRPSRVEPAAVFLDDGTLAGSKLTMDGAFRMLVSLGFSLVEAAAMCASNQARELGLQGQGVIAPGGLADLAVLTREHRVARTYIGGVAWTGAPS